MFRTVERPAFSAIQSNLFPIYFGLQTGLPIVLALTFPGNALLGIQSSIPGLLDASNRWGSLVPILTIFVTGLANLTVLLPVVTKVMKDRRGQGSYTINHGSVLGSTMLTTNSKTRWSRLVLPRSPFRGDASVEQEVWYAARNIFAAQPLNLHLGRCVRLHTWVAPELSIRLCPI
jgi:hypothetical protein